MLKVSINKSHTYNIQEQGKEVIINGQRIAFDLLPGDNKHIHIIKDQISYEVEVISFDPKQKSGVLKINSGIYSFNIQDQYDELLQRMGINTGQGNSVSEIKAPMPGLVLKIFASEGQAVKKGDTLLILEAMKMENIIKSPADGVIGLIKVKPGNKVEKNEVLMKFR